MKAFSRAGAVVVALGVVGFIMGADDAKVKVTLSEMHICCGACKKAVEKAATSVKGVEVAVEQEEGEEDEGTAELTAPSYAEIQMAIDEIAKAGFHGELDDEKVQFKPVKSPEGNVKKLEIAHVHNCCPGCANALKEALGEVDGVESNTVKPKQDSFVVEGDFVAGDVIQALLDAGFYPTLK